MKIAGESSPFVSRLLVVADRSGVTKLLKDRYPAVQVSSVPTYMSGIAQLSGGSVHAVLAYVDPTFDALDRAVRGLRRAVGESVPVVLYCDPESEPIARKALIAGATDYLICPPDPAQLDSLLSLAPRSAETLAPAPPTDKREMQALASVLEAMSNNLDRVPRAMAELLTTALSARSAEITAGAVTARSGESSAAAVLRESIVVNGRAVGEISIGAAISGSYSSEQIEKLRYYAGVFGHILNAAEQQHDWQQLALTDDLTRLRNRRYLIRFLDGIVDRASRERFRITLCMFDIDNFKQYNDRYGHSIGDEIIRATGQLLKRHCRGEDVVARYGGDEFVVVFWDAESPRVAGSHHPEEALAVMKRFQDALKDYEVHCLGPRGKGVLTISGGLVSYPWDAANTLDLIDQADAALRQAKSQGKGRIHLVGGKDVS